MVTSVLVVDVKVLGNWVAPIFVLQRTVSNLDSNAMKTQIVTSLKVTGARVEVRVSSCATIVT